RQSQLRLSCATWYEPKDTPAGAWPPLMAFQPVSLPGSFPGNTISPAFVFAAAYILLTDSNCGAVRQLSESPALHSNVDGSNLHVRGSSSKPSLTPSFASHAPITALFKAANFDAETTLDGSLSAGTATLKSHACK